MTNGQWEFIFLVIGHWSSVIGTQSSALFPSAIGQVVIPNPFR